jgi:glycosyltransferase involved in cell wall biosynthesis
MSNIILSILVLTVPSRINYFYPRLMNDLILQTEKYKDKIELLALFDNKKRSVGKKRQELIDISQGEFIVFIDDDDRIADDYIESIMSAILKDKDLDVLVFNTICNVNNTYDKLCKYGIEFEYGDINNGKEWRGKPAHTMVWRSSIVKKHKYQNISNGEDINWVLSAYKDINKQVRIDKILYWYDANYATTSETAGLKEDIIKKNVDKLTKCNLK